MYFPEYFIFLKKLRKEVWELFQDLHNHYLEIF